MNYIIFYRNSCFLIRNSWFIINGAYGDIGKLILLVGAGDSFPDKMEDGQKKHYNLQFRLILRKRFETMLGLFLEPAQQFFHFLLKRHYDFPHSLLLRYERF